MVQDKEKQQAAISKEGKKLMQEGNAKEAKKMEQEAKKLRTRITVLSVTAAATSTMLPFGLGSMISLLIAPALITTAFRLYALNEERNAAYKSPRPKSSCLTIL